jgi:hypothetical protein
MMRDGGIEGTPTPKPEEKYQSTQFTALISDPAFFQEQLPGFMRDIVKSPLRRPNSQSPQQPTALDIKTLDIWSNGSASLPDFVALDFARKQGWTKRTETTNFSGISFVSDAPVSESEFAEEQRAKWDKYLHADGIPRDAAMDAVYKFNSLYFSQTPSARYLDDSILEGLREKLGKAPYLLATKIFPDLNDQDTQKLFHQPVAKVRELAESVK